ncbi:rod shape-determining protein MreD [Thalassotalea agarivorans]|uniref:Rod shape-determining protein MreD n=1 Tax=Thalassotalea agarivorans TaxID=349064 RepID=A0A1I0FZB0_THASX|nr:rod shape-determining protein MreD [Thalassotalea agarivorans]SET63618.1 rod shape-determining protein MreD [Thalassotalea agarivorans]
MFAHNGFIVVLTLFIALLAAIMPMPLGIDSFRPDWVLVVLLYWAMAIPVRVSVGTAWVMGLLLDILLGSLLGVHAIALMVPVFIAAVNCQKIRNFSVWQQALVVGVLSALQHLLVFWLQFVFLDVVFLPAYLYPVVTTVIIWPWAFLLLRNIRRKFQIK